MDDEIQNLKKEVENAILTYEAANAHSAQITRRMVQNYGEIGALSKLMVSAKLQQGFIVLRDTDQLDKSFEAIVIRHKSLFDDNVVASAIFRFDHPFDLE